MKIIFLDLAEVLEIHKDQIQRYGGVAGVRDIRLLESAVAAPQSGAFGHYAHADLFEMAAAYLFHIIKNHPFLDGNKRTGTVVALVFLSLNGFEVEAEEKSLELMVLAVAEGKKDKKGVAKFFRNHTKHRFGR